MAKRAMFTGADNVKAVFEQAYQPGYAYSLSYSERGDPCFQYYEADIEKGKDQFDAYVENLNDAGNDDLLHLRFHPLPKGGEKFITKSSPVILVTPVRVCPIGSNPVISGVGEVRDNSTSWGLMKAISAIEKLPEQQAAFEAKIMGILEETEPEPKPVKVDKNQQYLEMAIGALKEPNVIANIQGIIKMFFPNSKLGGAPLPAIAGVHEPKEITMPEKALDPGMYPIDNYTNEQLQSLNMSCAILSQHCQLDSDLKILADMAQTNPQQFNFLLSMLRK